LLLTLWPEWEWKQFYAAAKIMCSNYGDGWGWDKNGILSHAVQLSIIQRR